MHSISSSLVFLASLAAAHTGIQGYTSLEHIQQHLPVKISAVRENVPQEQCVSFCGQNQIFLHGKIPYGGREVTGCACVTIDPTAKLPVPPKALLFVKNAVLDTVKQFVPGLDVTVGGFSHGAPTLNQPSSQHVAQPSAQQAVQPVTQNVAQPVAKHVTQPSTQPTPTPEPKTEDNKTVEETRPVDAFEVKPMASDAFSHVVDLSCLAYIASVAYLLV